jgi:hypothetical protein
MVASHAPSKPLAREPISFLSIDPVFQPPSPHASKATRELGSTPDFGGPRKNLSTNLYTAIEVSQAVYG